MLHPLSRSIEVMRLTASEGYRAMATLSFPLSRSLTSTLASPGKARDGFSIITLQTLAVQEDEVENEEKNDGLTPIPMEEVSEEPQIVQSPVPSEYPLASLSSDCLGKEFRLAILKTTQDFKVNKSNPYSWAWPGLVRLLANMEFRPKKSDILHESLDVWAAKNRDSLGAVRLVEIPQTPENGSEWALPFVSFLLERGSADCL